MPMAAFKAAIEAEDPALDLTPFINDTFGPGNFVSNFLAYHVAWYREWWNAQEESEDLKCLFSGHTHVGGQISVADAERAVEIQLNELFKVLPETEE